jgi:hypothetical protein
MKRLLAPALISLLALASGCAREVDPIQELLDHIPQEPAAMAECRAHEVLRSSEVAAASRAPTSLVGRYAKRHDPSFDGGLAQGGDALTTLCLALIPIDVEGLPDETQSPRVVPDYQGTPLDVPDEPQPAVVVPAVLAIFPSGSTTWIGGVSTAAS